MWHLVWHTPPPGGVAPVRMYPCGKAPRPARGPDDQPHRAARYVTHSSAPSWSSATSAPRAPGRGRACSPRPTPWPCSSATTRRTCTRRSLPGTTSRRAWPCSSSANSSSARRGSGSPGWASVSGSGRAFPRGRFRLRRNPAVSGPPRSILCLASSSNARLQSREREYDRRRTRTPAQHGGPGARGPVRGGSQVAFGIATENTGAQDRDQGRASGLRSQAFASAARGEGR